MILPRKGLPRNTSLVMEQQPSKHEPTFRRSSNVKIDDGLKCHKNIRATTNMHPLRFETAVANTPHPSKVHGEDAYFLLNNDDDRGDLRGSYFGVADGVGSWFERDVDPSCVCVCVLFCFVLTLSFVRSFVRSYLMFISHSIPVCQRTHASGTKCRE